jgi:hypothetical protein
MSNVQVYDSLSKAYSLESSPPLRGGRTIPRGAVGYIADILPAAERRATFLVADRRTRP